MELLYLGIGDKKKEDMIMKNIISNTKMLAALLMAGAAFTACSDKDNIIEEQPTAAKTYKMTVDASMGGGAQTRALYFNSTSLDVKWASNDHVSVFPAAWSLTPYGTLTAAESDTRNTTLTGDLTTLPAAGDHLNLLFPRATWDYTGQTGVLLTDENSIEKKYDYALADVTVNSITGNAIATTDANFASQQAIVKFILKNKSDNSSLNASSLTISAASNKLVKTKGFVIPTRHTGGYTCDGGTDGFDPASKLVDGNKTGTKWCVGNDHKSGGIWYCEFHTASAVQVDGYQLTTGHDNIDYNNRNPKDWVLKAKLNSDDAWTTIATVTNDATLEDINNKSFDFNVDVHGIYQYFRFEVSATRGADVMQIEELELFKSDYGTAYGDLTVTPDDDAASELTVALRNENDGADTYTVSAKAGGKKYAFSKDGVTFQNGKYYEITVKMTEQTASTVTWNFSEMSEEHAELYDGGYTYKDVTLSGEGNLDFSQGMLYAMGDLTFTNTLGKHFKSIVITARFANISGWTSGGEPDNWTYTWTGDAPSITIGANSMAEEVTSIVFTLE